MSIRVPDVAPVRLPRAPEVQTRLGSVATVPMYGAPVKAPAKVLKRAEAPPAPVAVTWADQIVQTVGKLGHTTASRLVQQVGKSTPLVRAELDALVAAGRLDRHESTYVMWTLPGVKPPPTLVDQLAQVIRDAGAPITVKAAAKRLRWDEKTVRNTAKNSPEIETGKALSLREWR
jgi:hypothetical protein